MRTIGQNGKYYLADEVDAEIAERDERYINMFIQMEKAGVKIIKLEKVLDAALYFVKEEPIERSFSAPARVLLDALEGM